MDTTTDKKVEPNMPLMPNAKIIELQAGSEYRIKDIVDHIKIIVSPEPQGLCEVFGRELPVNEPVFFHMGQKIAIYCWKKVQIQISGTHAGYDSNKTEAVERYANISYALNSLRTEALQ